MTRQPCSSEMKVTASEPTADLDPTSELEPADDDSEQSVLLDVDAAVTEPDCYRAGVTGGGVQRHRTKITVAQFVAHG